MTAYGEFVNERDALISPKSNEGARELAADIVALLELIAIHGSSGIAGNAHMRQRYVEQFQQRIINAVAEDNE